jgi:hypothetical protein
LAERQSRRRRPIHPRRWWRWRRRGIVRVSDTAAWRERDDRGRYRYGNRPCRRPGAAVGHFLLRFNHSRASSGPAGFATLLTCLHCQQSNVGSPSETFCTALHLGHCSASIPGGGVGRLGGWEVGRLHSNDENADHTQHRSKRKRVGDVEVFSLADDGRDAAADKPYGEKNSECHLPPLYPNERAAHSITSEACKGRNRRGGG